MIDNENEIGPAIFQALSLCGAFALVVAPFNVVDPGPEALRSGHLYAFTRVEKVKTTGLFVEQKLKLLFLSIMVEGNSGRDKSI